MTIEKRRREGVAPTARLVEFLRELANMRRRQVTDVERYEQVRWLSDAPDQVRLITGAGPGEVVLSIDPVATEPPPPPPANVAQWVDAHDIESSHLDQPPLAATIPADELQAIGGQYGRWIDRWRVWAEADRRLIELRTWYDELAQTARLLEQQDDVYELVIGTGLLTWTTGEHEVRHPLLTTRVDVIAEATTGRIDVVIPDDGSTRIDDRALLAGLEGFDSQRPETVRDELRSSAAVPLDDLNKDLLSRWQVAALPRWRPYEHTWEPSAAGEPAQDVRFAPALILRERDRTSLIDYFDRMLAALSGPDAVAPLGLAQLLSALEPEDRLAWLESEGATDGATVGEDPLFPLPSNPEQRQIIDRMRHDNGVVVQGPPGTGKTHTIANLLTALLARGQRVLVTSEKAQALRVLRDKLPPEVRDLCVSMTDVARGGSRELDRSVTALSDRYGTFSPARHEELVRRNESARAAARQRVADLTERMRALRESETYQHPAVSHGYQGTKARIAEELRRHAPECDWMPVPVPTTAPVDPPLSIGELAELRAALASSTPERRARTSQVLPDMSTIPTTVRFRSLVAAEAAAAALAREAETELSKTLRAVGADDLAALRTEVDGTQAALSGLGLGGDPVGWPEGWTTRALGDGLAGRELAMWQRLAELARHADEAQGHLNAIGLRTVTLPPFEAAGPNSLMGQLAAGHALQEHLAGGNELRRRFRPAVQKQAQQLIDGATVDGSPVGNPALLAIVLATLDAESLASSLTREWSAAGVQVDPTLPTSRRIAQLVDLSTRLDAVLTVVAHRDTARDRLARRGVNVPLASAAEWYDLVRALGAVEARIEAERATETLEEVAARLEIDSQAPTAAPEIARLSAATQSRDAEAYESHLTGLAGAFAQQAEQARADELWQRLHPAHPALAEQLAQSANSEVWSDRFAALDRAWAWGKARTFFDDLRSPGLEDRLAAELRDAVDQVGRTTAVLAAEEAWGRCLLRMSAPEEQALRSYRAHIDERGSGHGRWAGRFAAAAREAMVEARGAVPAWIMPLREVVETIPPDQNSFDVVIIDEASQAGIEALFLLWLAPRVIVVGDERQCAPSQVVRGELQPIFDRLDDYLADVPEHLRLAFTPKSNLFSLLQTRFGSVIRLREHFRCMPEIIEWSSQQFYADAPLVPLRQFGADRLPPLRTVRVTGAVSEGASTRLRNTAEADALVSELIRCLHDPAYASRTFGVVVLQGKAQASLIESMLQQQVAPDEWERRKLRVGSPPAFQGDERDVVFISMVIAERRNAVTSREWQRRFNVAASRAKDQMWLFHSVSLDLLSPADLRRSMLAYMLNPPAPRSMGDFADLKWGSDKRDPFDSKFEQRVFIALRDRGYHVTPQYEVNGRHIDLVVSGAKGRLAVECDGDHWHSRPEDQLADLDRELELQRSGWRFWRVRESEFYLDPDRALSELWDVLEERGIRPGDLASDGDHGVGGAEVWEAAALSGEEGLDGLDGNDPSDLDEFGSRPTISRPGPSGRLSGKAVSVRTAPTASRAALVPPIPTVPDPSGDRRAPAGVPAEPASPAPWRIGREAPVARPERSAAPRRREPGGISLADLVQQGRIRAGELLHARYHGSGYTVEVLPDGGLRSGSAVFATPTEAAKQLTGQASVNGWIFWRTQAGTRISELRR